MSTPSSGPLDVAQIRADFPILAQPMRGGKPLVYLDSAATSQKPRVVIDTLRRYYEEQNANVHRGIHELGERATEAFEAARGKVAAFIGAPSERSLVWTRGTTEGINLVAYAWGRHFLNPGDEIVTSVMEHHSNLVPWQLLARDTGAALKFIPVLDDGTLDLEAYAGLLNPRVKLVAVTQMSNVLGTVNPVREMAAQAHAVGALFLADGAQSVPHMPVNVQELDVDFLAFSGHKMCGPTGIGGLYIRERIAEAMEPFHGGGEMISTVKLEGSTWADLPHKFEAGTPDISGVIGLGAAVDYLTGLGMDRLHAVEQELTAYAAERLASVEGLTLFGRAPGRGGALSFALDGAHPHDISHFADRDGIALRAGHMCCQPLMTRFGVGALTRASLSFYNTREEIDVLVEALGRIGRFFRRGTR